MVLIKICGITNLEDALVSTEAGADMLGFNFYRRSPRYIAPEDAREIIERLPASILNVGVFVNEETPEDVLKIADEAGLNMVQLHGEESNDYCRRVEQSGRDVIKALRVGPGFTPEDALKFEVDSILLDAFSRDERGGTGKVFDWSRAIEVRRLIPKLYLAGGLAPENIAEAIHHVNPFAVDACSGLESSPGKKDAARVSAFIRIARETANERF